MSLSGETGTSSTPPRANIPAHGASTIGSTTNSRGTAVVSESIGLVSVNVKEIRPWIQWDIEQAKQCKLDAMLHALLQRASSAPETKQPEFLKKCLKVVLPGCNGQVSAGGIYSSGVETALNDYVRPGVIPELPWHYTFTNPTSAIREALGVPQSSKGLRVLYIIVFPKLQPITKLYDRELFDVWRQCIICHFTLWKEGVYHRDVSPGNLMWYWRDGKRMGVLNDYDISPLANDQGPRGNERTGTVLFMAVDLLSLKSQRGEVKHLYRHGLESFIWCFAWICLRYEQGVLLPAESRPLDIWATAGAVTCGEKKYFFLRHFEDYNSSHLEPLTWNFLVECLWELKTDNERRFNLRMKQRLSGAGEQPDAEESNSNIDDFSNKFSLPVAIARTGISSANLPSHIDLYLP